MAPAATLPILWRAKTDACDFTNTFWVSVAGLTDVEVDVVVTDTWSGQVWNYDNDQGNMFDTTIDVGAFQTCTP